MVERGGIEMTKYPENDTIVLFTYLRGEGKQLHSHVWPEREASAPISH